MKTIMMVLALALVSGTAIAQPGGGRNLERMQEELGLTEEQVEQIREIRESGGGREEIHEVLTEEQQAKAHELRSQRKEKHAGKLERMQEELELTDEQLAEMREIRESGGSRKDMHAVLTDEQQAKFEELRAQRKGKRGKGPHGGPPAHAE